MKSHHVHHVEFFFTRGTGRISNVIAQTSVPIWQIFSKKKYKDAPSHVGLVFDTDDGEQVFEAHIDTDWLGPKPWSDITSELNENPKRRLWTVDPQLSEGAAQDIWERCHHQLGLWDYDVSQLGRIYGYRRLRLPIPQDSAKIVCSEAGSRVSFPHIDMRKIARIKKKKFDLLSPANMMKGFDQSGYTVVEALPDELAAVPS